MAPDWTGDARLRDAETGVEREFTSTPVTQAAYVGALARRTGEIERSAHRRGLRFARVSTDEPIDDMVLRSLRRLGLLAWPSWRRPRQPSRSPSRSSAPCISFGTAGRPGWC